MSHSFYSANPERDWQDTQDAMEAIAQKHPVCELCHKHILDDSAFKFGDDFFHEDCFYKEYRVDVEKYVD